MNNLKKLLEFLNKLDEYGIGYAMEHNREDSMTVFIAVPGERWEVDFRADGEVEVEVFYSGAEEEEKEGEEALDRLFADYDEEEYEDEEDEYDDEDEEEYEDEDYEEEVEKSDKR
ncbi:hypothetical protein F6455_11840 [Proteobacteria bacterium 005FR1]|nr:hypothetical protein [Proteobacteria bacterium 005FR1]